MTEKEIRSLSKFMSLILRHRPEKINISLDENGWANISDLVKGINKDWESKYTIDDIKEVVSTNDKQRFSFNKNYTKIRANQGHSVSVDVELSEDKPLNTLYHGTSLPSLQGIMINGIQSKKRLYVHLSSNEATANDVGRRHGKPVVLKIDAVRMYEDGYKFYLSVNGVWLTKCVPASYISKD